MLRLLAPRSLLLPTIRTAVKCAPVIIPSRAAATFSASTTAVRQLRERTGAPMMECKAALQADGVNGDLEKAQDWLRKKGMTAASKKSGRAAAQGLVAVSVHPTSLVAVLVELNSETDFVARNELFKSAAVGISSSALATFSQCGDGAFSSPVFGDAVVAAADPAKLAALAVPGAGAAALTAADLVTDLIAKIRENIVLRRAGALVLAPPAPGAASVIGSYVHNAAGTGLGSIGVLVGLAAAGSGTTPLAGTVTPALADLARKIAMHVAASRPLHASRGDVPAEALERERAILRSQAAASGKAEAHVAKMVEGRLSKFYADTVLADQPYVLSDSGAPVGRVLEEQRKALGLSLLRVAGFISYAVGETTAPPPAEPTPAGEHSTAAGATQ